MATTDKVTKVVVAINQFAGIGWAKWAAQVLHGGTGKARRYRKVRELQEHAGSRGQLYQMADDGLEF
eukprot:9086485-Pyramimonas_sp.AAC.1